MAENSDSGNKGIIAIIPAFNEEISIGSIVLNTKKYVDSVIVVDDGSIDNTAEVARVAGAKVIRHTRNMGKGNALKSGFSAACQVGTKVIVTIDADGQHNPNEIPKVIAPILSKEADMVVGSRYLNVNAIPFYRRIGQRVLDFTTNLNTGSHIIDTQSGFRAFDINAVPNFLFEQKGFSIESEMLTEAVNAGLKIKEVDIKVRYDVDCNTENPVVHGMKVFINILHNIQFKKPIYYFTIPGLMLGTFGLGMGLDFLQGLYGEGNPYFGFTLLMILLTLVGLFLAFTGIILHFMSGLMQNKINSWKKK